MKRRLLKMVALVGLVCAAFTVAAQAAPAEDVTLRFTGPQSQRAPWESIIANFERVYPNIDVEATYVPAVQFGAVLLTQIQGGTAPDVFATNAGAQSPYAVFALGFQGKLLDLTGSPWVKRMYPGYAKYVSVKRRIYGAPTGYGPSGLLYNKDVFKSLNLKIPTTYSQLLATCRQIKAAGKTPIFLGMGNRLPINFGTQIMTAFVYSKDPGWTLKRIQKKVTFAGSPLWQRAMQAIVEMKDTCFQPNAAATTDAQQYLALARGDAAMTPSFSSEYDTVRTINPSVQLGQFPLPSEKASDTFVSYSTGQQVLVATKDSDRPNEAKTFINFIMRPKQNAFFNKVAATVSGGDMRAGVLPDFLAGNAALLKAGKGMLIPVVGWPGVEKGLYNPSMLGKIIGLFTGQKTPAQLLSEMDELWDRPTP